MMENCKGARAALAAGGLALILTGGNAVRAQSGRTGADWGAVEMVLQTSSSRELKASAIQNFLGSESYLASIQPGLVSGANGILSRVLEALRHGRPPAPAAAESKLDRRLIYVSSQQIGVTTVAVSVVARDEERARGAAALILKSLQAMQSEGKASQEAILKNARRELEEAQHELQMQQLQVDALREECAGMEPDHWLGVLRPRLEAYIQKSWDQAMDVAIQRALREQLAARLDALPKVVAAPGKKVENPEYIELLQKIAMARTELNILSERSKRSGAEDVSKEIEKFTREIAQLEAQRSTTARTIPGPAAERPNPERLKVEKRLLDAEERIARAAAEQVVLEKTIADLRQRVMQQEALEFRMQALLEGLERARSRLMNAQKRVEQMRSRAIQQDATGFHLVAGPTVVRVD